MRALLVALVACSSAAPPVVTAPPAAGPIVASAAPLDAAIDAPIVTPDAAVVTPAPLVLDVSLTQVPPLEGTPRRIKQGQTLTSRRVKISMLPPSTSVKAGGTGAERWRFTFQTGPSKVEVAVDDTKTEALEAEIGELGASRFVFRRVTDTEFDIYDLMMKTLSDEQCEGLIQGKAKAANLPRGPSSRRRQNGFFKLSEQGWTAHCGVYSGRVWFTLEDVPATPASVFTKPPALKGKVTKIKAGESIKLRGVTLTFTSANAGRWSFNAYYPQESDPFDLESTTVGFEAEVVVHRMLLVLRQVDATTFEVVDEGTTQDAGYDVDSCLEHIRRGAAKRNLAISSTATQGEDNGIVTFTSNDWRGNCGRQSGRVWFSKS